MNCHQQENNMKASEGRLGRVFVIRLEDGDLIPSCIEVFAHEKNIRMAIVFLIGGIGEGQVVVGPRRSDEMPPEPMLLPLDGAHEIIGTGFIIPDKNSSPKMHMHAALGRSGQTITGCVRPGVKTWLVGEAVIYEILGADARRLPDKMTGFELLEVTSSD
jgi:predicted DNA-binding protein with PD1-like motif